jgi:sugar phosphate isomerase/epimerase
MNRWQLVVGVGLAVVLCGFRAVAGEDAPAAGKGLSNPFFPYEVRVPDKVLQELGYVPIHYVYTGINIDKDPAYPANLKDQIRSLKGTDTIFWLTISGNRGKDNDEKAVAALRDLAAAAEEVGVKLSIYPHSGNYAATAREALRIVKKVDRKSVGVTITLCHELMGDQGPDLPQIIDDVAPHLFVVTINGADKKEKGQSMGWDRLIQPLGQGDFDVYSVLRKLKAAGFTGPIGLQCYGLKGDPLIHLKQSIAAWKDYSARLAAEGAGTGK